MKTYTNITEKAREEAEKTYIDPTDRGCYTRGYVMGYEARAAEEPTDEQVAQIIADHREATTVTTSRSWTVKCRCGHTSHAKRSGLGILAAFEDEQASHRAHAVHVAAQLRAARDTGEQA